MAIASCLSQLLLFVGLKFVKADEGKYIFTWIVWFSSLVSFVVISLWVSGVDYSLIYKLYTPLELLGLSYVLLSMLEQSINSKIAIIIVSFILYIFCAVFGSNLHSVDISETLFECAVLSILAMVVLIEGVKPWQWFIAMGILIYSFINLYSYPENHLAANIIMNVFFFVALIK